MKLPEVDIQQIPAVLQLNRRLMIVIAVVIVAGIAVTAGLTTNLQRDDVRSDLRYAAAAAAAMLESRISNGISLQTPDFTAGLRASVPQGGREAGDDGTPRLHIVGPEGRVPMLALSSNEGAERRLVPDAVLRKSLELFAGPHVDGVLVVERDGGLVTGIGAVSPAIEATAVGWASRLALAPGSSDRLRVEQGEVSDIGPFDSLELAAMPLSDAPYIAVALHQERFATLLGAAALDTLLLVLPGLVVAAVLAFSLYSQEGRRRRLFEEMASQNMRYRLGLMLADAGTLDWDLETDDVYFSMPWLEMLGLKSERLKGRAWSWHRRIHPEDRERVLARYRYQASQPPEPFEQTYRLLDVDGNSVEVRERAAIHHTPNGGSAFIIVHERLSPSVQRESPGINFLPDREVERAATDTSRATWS